jgi:hypothetical protein
MLDLDLLELFKTFPMCMTVLVVIPVAFFTSPATAAHEFKAFRMQHYDLHGVHYGELHKITFTRKSCNLFVEER